MSQEHSPEYKFIPETVGNKTSQKSLPVREEIRQTVAEIIKIFIIATVVILPIRYFLIQPFYVKGASMEPNFHENEYLIIDKIAPRFEPYKRGEAIVFLYPPTDHRYLIKRLIGLPGERVVITHQEIYIYNKDHLDGFQLDEKAYNPYLLRDQDVDITLHDDQYFVLGDNRPVSFDSEYFGPINKDQITGRVFFRGWPIERITIFKAPSY